MEVNMKSNQSIKKTPDKTIILMKFSIYLQQRKQGKDHAFAVFNYTPIQNESISAITSLSKISSASPLNCSLKCSLILCMHVMVPRERLLQFPASAFLSRIGMISIVQLPISITTASLLNLLIQFTIPAQPCGYTFTLKRLMLQVTSSYLKTSLRLRLPIILKIFTGLQIICCVNAL